ncbi:AAA family ATPase [Alkaliphilus pronyensis]|uniref:DNA 5'-3' helicase n=1 Tax=Alkaliphilus pronyensis TaxID=1482732 RepID=A0A6I0F7Z7_9FIRM|nr:DnaB-like helicase C-terminal domain-containing protein [Alkaliphilus pronyensis]KAB3533846.1 AAA family ATPase [Alkaliphilus pronyensis]
MNIPHSIEIEQTLLGNFLLDKNTLYAIEKLNIDDFYNEFHQAMFQVVRNLRNDNKTVDYIQVHEGLKKLGLNDLPYLNSLISNIPFSESTDHYVNTIREKSILRRLISECQTAISMATTGQEDPRSIKATLANKLDSIGTEQNEESDRLQDIFLKLIDDIENSNSKEQKKYLTGITDLDIITTGLHKEEVVVVAARPGVGKTALALQISRNLAINGLNILLLSREMSKAQMAKRFTLSKSNINGKRLRTGNVNDEEWKIIIETMIKLSKLPININTTCRSIPQIKNKLRETKADVLIIDYLQLLEPMNKSANREQQVSELSREIKNISLDFKIPVVLLSQLNRNADLRRPTLADLRESGAIEQDANSVVFIHLPAGKEIEKAVKEGLITEEFLQECTKNKNKVVEVIIAKQRDGELGEFYLQYMPNKLTFLSISNRRE